MPLVVLVQTCTNCDMNSLYVSDNTSIVDVSFCCKSIQKKGVLVNDSMSAFFKYYYFYFTKLREVLKIDFFG
jgi:phosphoribosylaminoimidazole-succinocarboxamide synthase